MIIGTAFGVVSAVGLAVRPQGDCLIHGTGTVKQLGFEGGFYGIIGDDGKNYDPTNLPQAYKVTGLRVRFTAKTTNLASFHLWGYGVDLISIERLRTRAATCSDRPFLFQPFLQPAT